ncbi:MAG: AMP-binding protein [Candidatus Marinimicrobia bacterium]|nr:AMP-binding protein [Candidatus Neomarinimicrobiota bacterium]
MLLKSDSKTALIWKDETYSYSDILRHVHFYATLFDQKTKKVAIFAENRPEWVFAFYAAWKNNSIAVPIDFMAKPDEVAFILNDCQPEQIFYSRESQEILNKALESVKHKPAVHCFEDQQYESGDFSPDEIDTNDVMKTAAIIYTSGTTGSPKGVMLSFDNILANVEAVSETIPIYTNFRTVLALLPYHHIFPLMGAMIAPLKVGGKIAFSPSIDSKDIIETLQKNAVNIIIGVPRLYSAIRKGIMDKINAHFLTRALFGLAKVINSRAFSRKLFKTVHQKFGGHVEYMVSGGAKLDEDAAKDFKTLGFEMLEGFGMTEAAPMITFTRPGKWEIGSAGQAMPNLDVEIRDGEIVARGRNIMQGYYNRPEETADVLKDGWLYTGDLGTIDKNGYLRITGRKKEIIVLSSGKNINPEEVEKKLKSISDCIADVGVFMNNDQVQAAFYPDFELLRERGILNIDELFRLEIVDKYNHMVSYYKKISKFIILKEELPKTRLGKLQRFKLADLANIIGLKKHQTTEPDHEEYRVIRDFLMKQTKSDIFPDDHIEIDLGLDSLDKVSLQTFLQSTFGIKIPEDILIHHPTVEKLSAFMRKKKNKISIEVVKWAEIFKEKVELTLPKSWFTWNIFKHISKGIFRLFFRLKGKGMENIPAGPCIIVPNHQSFLDGLFVSVFLDNKTNRKTYFYAKEKHVSKRWVKALANRHNIIITDINHNLKLSLQKLAEVLKNGKNIVIFPEGTRTRTGKISAFKKSFAILSCELNVPIVPVSIKGAFEALPRGSIFPKPWKKISVKFHKPVYPEGHNYESLLDQVYSKLAAELA